MRTAVRLSVVVIGLMTGAHFVSCLGSPGDLWRELGASRP
jgi:hypothetical protein